MGRRFKVVAVGGTFDSLHKGHRTLLLQAFKAGEHVIVGLSSDEFVESMRKNHPTASYARRLKELKTFLSKIGLLGRTEIVSLDNAHGPALLSGNIKALVVSRETEPAAVVVNKKRRAAGLPPLKVIVVDLINAEDGSPISTTRIRRGEVDREGSLLRTCSK